MTRRSIHCYVTEDAYDDWHAAAFTHGSSVTALVDRIGPRLPEILNCFACGAGHIPGEARAYSDKRRRRGGRKKS